MPVPKSCGGGEFNTPTAHRNLGWAAKPSLLRCGPGRICCRPIFISLHWMHSFLSLISCYQIVSPWASRIRSGLYMTEWLSTHALWCLSWGKGGREKMGRGVERERNISFRTFKRRKKQQSLSNSYCCKSRTWHFESKLPVLQRVDLEGCHHSKMTQKRFLSF